MATQQWNIMNKHVEADLVYRSADCVVSIFPDRYLLISEDV